MSSSTAPQNNQPTENPSTSHNYKWIKRFFLFFILMIILVIGYRFVNSFFPSSEKKVAILPKPVAVAVAKHQNVPIIFTELGTVIPIANITVPARTSGYLQQVYFTEGQMVKKGDLLALIDPRPYEALKSQYEGTLKSDEASLKQAKLDNARYQQLLKQNSIAPMTAQDQQYKVAQLEGQIKADQALIKQQELNIMYSHIRASVDGRIGIRQVDAGNYVTEGQSNGIAILTQMTPISVILTVPENKLSMVLEALKQKSELSVEAWNSDNTEKLADGKTSVIDSQIDTSTGTVRMRAIFPNANWELFPNQFVNAHILVKNLHDVITVPNNAIQTGPDGSFVYIVQDNSTVKLQNIKTGYNDGENTIIESGLKLNDKVVTDGIDQLRNGAKVTIPNNPQ
ncbi:Multidrug efflux pump subunit AcrA (membrane-fusion protein) (AcrA) (PDB:1T5E) [Commensalibacter communis]|uniref:Multidrug efflux pump subunit AcrA (Membrane-fusion protein) (AcrA) n=1 Tax=Commensalibacter communis TaxID=2972786 RepID=A0A9W4TM82_9PROT|nr:efflux RND transporter periplasmic adaptor subunit [Commensalibacter communis]CAI3923651.1 Multidrug efflux pump subunit AcrA (membrane-fusion protein) (AcrA) (PDB:1T5E) [Commensalibacter communis]CAI3925140.1 Multidrug efflux pump subunit AcrA (membrane-fusion protein) (AcrA) (PDB:1T5E) [Commensalibacter communis]CAI3929582.1 Multidrug efflux pump subunit AcrA (membrane-fusion protein) (AcrA) (PDB:1T5E) [Commensalibacter communis]CAI3937298.1 Multidrug efflux pump subunit AcrA (membrane-fus